MKNFDERPKREEFDERPKREQDVIPFERRPATAREMPESFLPSRQMEELRSRWTVIQSSFVDEPRKAVEEADRLLMTTIKQLEETFSAERANIQKHWSRGEEVSTEDFRLAFQNYRAFFDRLLSKM
jgi:hypothetical protein